ncbi:MAG TPA: lipoprotein [Gammaproteobacteria bacterium]
MRTLRHLILYALFAASLLGCGQTGPLYLPKPPASPHAANLAAPAATVSVPAASSVPAAATATPPAPASPPPQRIVP